MGLERFHEQQQHYYPIALREMRQGYKQSHWIWFIFPQLASLGHSRNAIYYGIRDLQEAADYMRDPILRKNLLEITRVLLELPSCDPCYVMSSSLDARKLRSCMTLFSQAAPEEPIFRAVLDKFFEGQPDNATLRLLRR